MLPACESRSISPALSISVFQSWVSPCFPLYLGSCFNLVSVHIHPSPAVAESAELLSGRRAIRVTPDPKESYHLVKAVRMVGGAVSEASDWEGNGHLPGSFGLRGGGGPLGLHSPEGPL